MTEFLTDSKALFYMCGQTSEKTLEITSQMYNVLLVFRSDNFRGRNERGFKVVYKFVNSSNGGKHEILSPKTNSNDVAFDKRKKLSSEKNIISDSLNEAVKRQKTDTFDDLNSHHLNNKKGKENLNLDSFPESYIKSSELNTGDFFSILEFNNIKVIPSKVF